MIMCSDQRLQRKTSGREKTGLQVTGLNDGETITFGINSGDGSTQLCFNLTLRCINSHVCSK